MVWENVASLLLLRELISELLITIVHMYYEGQLSSDLGTSEDVYTWTISWRAKYESLAPTTVTSLGNVGATPTLSNHTTTIIGTP